MRAHQLLRPLCPVQSCTTYVVAFNRLRPGEEREVEQTLTSQGGGQQNATAEACFEAAYPACIRKDSFARRVDEFRWPLAPAFRSVVTAVVAFTTHETVGDSFIRWYVWSPGIVESVSHNRP